MKTFKFVTSILFLSIIFVAAMVVICSNYFARTKKGVDFDRKQKIRIIGLAVIAASTLVVIILALI